MTARPHGGTLCGERRWYTAAEMMDLPAALDLQTTCDWLGISRRHGYNLLQAGKFPIPHIRAGTLYRFRSVDLIELLGGQGGGSEV